MSLPNSQLRLVRPGPMALAVALTIALVFSGAATEGNPGGGTLLQIGTSGSLAHQPDDGKATMARNMLQTFIREETGLNNRIGTEKDWRELAEKLSKGQLQLGVFQGYELAWAKEEFPGLKPLALAVNTHCYPVACVMVRVNHPAADFMKLQGQSLGLTGSSQRYLRLYVESQVQSAGKELDSFFSKLTTPETVEDALDDVVDGVVGVTVVDRAALDAYRRRNPGRCKLLKEVTRSQPFPPVVVAYHEGSIDPATLRRFRDGLLNASRKERGQMMLTLFHLTTFATVPDDFGRVLAQTRKAYPPAEPQASVPTADMSGNR